MLAAESWAQLHESGLDLGRFYIAVTVAQKVTPSKQEVKGERPDHPILARAPPTPHALQHAGTTTMTLLDGSGIGGVGIRRGFAGGARWRNTAGSSGRRGRPLGMGKGLERKKAKKEEVICCSTLGHTVHAALVKRAVGNGCALGTIKQRSSLFRFEITTLVRFRR